MLEELRENKELWKTFCGWKETCQQEYLDLCTGVKGIKLLYDTYFKAIMNPDTRPDRFNDFISEMLGQRVKVLKVLPNESARIAAESPANPVPMIYADFRSAPSGFSGLANAS